MDFKKSISKWKEKKNTYNGSLLFGPFKQVYLNSN